MERKRQAFCSMDKSQIVARGATSCCHDCPENYNFKGFFCHLNVMIEEKKKKKPLIY